MQFSNQGPEPSMPWEILPDGQQAVASNINVELWLHQGLCFQHDVTMAFLGGVSKDHGVSLQEDTLESYTHPYFTDGETES